MIIKLMWDIEEAARETGRCPATISACIHTRKLVPDAYEGRTPLFKPETIQQFFRDRRSGRKPSTTPRLEDLAQRMERVDQGG